LEDRGGGDRKTDIRETGSEKGNRGICVAMWCQAGFSYVEL